MTAKSLFQNRGFGSVESQSLGKPAARFPAAIATDSDLAIAVDRQQTALAQTLDSVSTSMTVYDSSSIKAYNLLSIDSEIVKVTGTPAGGVVPIQRGFDGTAAGIHLAGAPVSGFVDAWHHNALVAEIEAIEGSLGTNLSKIPASPFVVSKVYDFAPQTPGGTLNPGTNSITLTPVPPGVNGTDPNHYLYIDQGTGTAEAVLITGGTAVAGAATGTVFVTCANTHSGAWRISSATAGIQEAVVFGLGSSGTGPTAILIPAGTHYILATVSVRQSGAYISVRGCGEQATLIQAGTMESDVFFFGPGVGLDFGDLAIYSTAMRATSTGVYLTGIADGVVTNLRVAGQATSIRIRSSARLFCDNLMVSGTTGIWVDSDPASPVTTTTTGIISNVRVLSPAGGVGILCKSVISGLILNGIFTEGGAYGIRIVGDSANPINEIQIVNFILDSYTLIGCDILLSNASASTNRCTLRCGMIASTSTVDAASYAIAARATVPGQINTLMLQDLEITYFTNNGAVTGSGITLAGADCTTIENVSVRSGDGFGSGIDFTFPATNGTMISGCRLGMNQDGLPLSGMSQRAILIEGQSHSYIYAAANMLAGSITSVLNNSTDLSTNLFDASNMNLPTAVVASAAALAVPAFPFFTITGTTPVTSFTGLSAVHAGRAFEFVPTGGNITFTAGATIGNTITINQNTLGHGRWDGTKVWLK